MFKINHLHLGVFGGLVGICVSGLLMKMITPVSQSYLSIAPVLCGALGGLGFGALTRGNNKLRGLIGCVFGLIAIVIGLMMTYVTPIVIGYMTNRSTDELIPLHLWHEYTFVQFVGIQLLSLHGLLVFFEGLGAAYFLASHLPLKAKHQK